MQEKQREAISPAQGADTLVWLVMAEASEPDSGGYYYRRALRKPNPQVEDEAALARLWRASEELVFEAGQALQSWT